VKINNIHDELEVVNNIDVYINHIRLLSVLHANAPTYAPTQPSFDELVESLYPKLHDIVKQYPEVFANPPHASKIPSQPEDMHINLKNPENIKQ
jgi:hypothetical protein